MSETATQLKEEDEDFIQVPYAILKTPLYPNGGRKLALSEIMLFSAVYSFSDAESQARCNKSFSRFGEDLRLSRGTVGRGIKALKQAGKIEQDKSRRFCASYTCVNFSKGRRFIKIELYLKETQFKVKGEAEPRYLTNAELLVLCHIKTHCSHVGEFVGGVRSIAETLGLSESTVDEAIKTLLRAELIYRPERGLNGWKRSKYTVNKKLMRQTKKTHGKKAKKAEREEPAPAEKLTEAERAHEARTEYERYYAERRRIAEARADQISARLNADDTYKRVYAEIRRTELEQARAEVFNLPEAEELRRRLKRLRAERARRMAELCITESDLKPNYQCPKCEDTGYRKTDGRMCDCYPKRGRKP